MQYTIFNGTKTVSIDDYLVRLYEDNVAEMNDKRIECLIASSDSDDTMTSLKQIIHDAILEEVNMFKKIPDIIKECDLLEANEELEVVAFGENRNLKLNIVKDCEYNRKQDKDYSNLVTIVTSQLFDKFTPVDDTENTYVTDGALWNELNRIYYYRNFALL